MTDELLEMQKDNFKALLFVTWVASIVALWVSLLAQMMREPATAILWASISPLNFAMYRLSLRRFRLATWIWVSAVVGILVLLTPWQAAPNVGVVPYGFILTVVVSGLLISRNATLYMAALSTLGSLVALGVEGHLLDVSTLQAIFPPLVITWTAAVLGWISSDQLVTALEWTRNAQLEANIQAEHLRDSRDELRKSLLIRENLNAQLQEANEQVSHRAVQLETVAEASRRITSLLDLEQLLTEVTNLICDKFGFYYTGVFLVDETDDFSLEEPLLVLRAAGGERGPALLRQGLRLPVDDNSLNGRAANTNQVQCVNDISMYPYYRRVDLLRDTISELSIPLHIGRRLVGTLDVQSTQVNAFTKDDIAVLEGLASQVAIAIQNTRLYESEQARRQVAETLREVGHILSSTLDLDQVLDRFLEQLALVVPYSRAAVMMQSGDVLHVEAARGFGDSRRAAELDMNIHENDVFSQVSQSRQVLIISDVEAYPEWTQVDWLPLDHSWMGAPLIVQDEVIGMLSLTRKERSAFNQDEVAVIFTFANQAAIAIHNARLYEQIRDFNLQLEQKVQERTGELEQAYTLLEQLDRNKSDFINIAAHELRTPLTVMKGYTAMMYGDQMIKQSPYLLEAVSGVLKGTDRLYEIVNSMLDVARIDSQVLDLCPEVIELATIIERLRNEFTPSLQERRLNLHTDNMSSLPLIKADSDMLYKVFYSVIINAIKYTPDGGTITISGHKMSDERLGECVEIIVSDTGIGIDPEHHELIFEKFYQTGKVALHSSGRTKFKGGGPGLGLAIARGIVQAHNGRIWVESAGHDESTCPGSNFHILLPVSGVEERVRALS
ncbi:MAG: GAF domain-containing protein [Thermoflexales bacterium]|nr:GAF domain-containing protein [Thermoflexales bacterium]